MELKLFPWDKDEKPYWINPENGLEWYVDKSTTEWCKRGHINGWKKLNAVVFYVADKKEDGKVYPLERVLIDADTNEVLAAETSLEAMAVKIDMIRMSLSL
jgi:hypothetical protein